MKLASIKSRDRKNRNGELVVVSKDNRLACRVDAKACSNLLDAAENWREVKSSLEGTYRSLNQGKAGGAFELNISDCIAPLTNAPGFYDGSAFLSHVFRARKSRGDVMPESAKKTPLMYQGVSDNLLGHNAPIELMEESFGGDFEGELGVIVSDVPKATKAKDMDKYIILLTLFNDITYRELVKTEIETKFGFLQSKPNSSFAPFVVTPDELSGLWKDGRIHTDILVKLDDQVFGMPNGSEMHFSFHDLVAHACRTRPLSAGSIIGSGTVSNESKEKGFACLTEKRFQEIIDQGRPITPWLKPNNRGFMDVVVDGVSVFGNIDEKVVL